MTPTVSVAFARTDDPAAEALPAELALLSPKATPKRRRDFAAGRAAARAAVAALTGRAGAAVLRDASGRPVLAGTAGLHLSISHADGVAVAAAARAPVGIDLVTVERHDPAFEAEAFAHGELAAWAGWLDRDAGDPLVASAAFAAKEAALKWLGLGLTVPLQSLAVLPVPAPASGEPPLPAARAFAVDVERRPAEPQRLPAWLALRHAQVVVLVGG